MTATETIKLILPQDKLSSLLAECGISPQFVKSEDNLLDHKLTIIKNGLNEKSLERFLKAASQYSYADGDTPAQAVFNKLREKKVVLGIAESLTGGAVCAEMVKIAGVSECFFKGIVAYDNSVKISALGVKREDLSKYGAVSSVVAEQMAKGLLGDGVTVGISTTGIAGPSGGSTEKPVGTVWFGYADGKNVNSRNMLFYGDRDSIRMQAVQYALFMLYKNLQD
ncbi:MAG TPA: nicotinamide-nucleotide amidohydrolase family protein [Candidatus Faecicola pullistercoris]|nr:nicotinamide-nucleotide amidohydrolase family protein [Candidatus Faecicola pullistercoris]